MNRPNLFDFATSELSQDAFICWLLSWADPGFNELDKGLHDCGVRLISAFFDKKNDSSRPSKIESVKIHRQYKNIDVLCIVNGEYPIIIEDKTHTKNHSKQLQRYYEVVKGQRYCEDKIIPIYYKTEDQGNYSEVESNNYYPFLRDDILAVLDTYTGSNSILVDYKSRLQKISDDTQSYINKPVEEWGWRAYKGFYMYLQKELGYGDWGFVPNQGGGFLGFWWGFKGDANCRQHLQIESHPSRLARSQLRNTGELQRKSSVNNLHFKIKVEEAKSRSSLRRDWHRLYNDKVAISAPDLHFSRPKRFGNGKHMTTNTYLNYIQVDQGGLVNIERTVAVLNRANEVLASTYKDPQK